MSLGDTLRNLFSRAKDQASDFAQMARTKLEIKDLEGRRDHALREIGRKIYTMHKDGRAPAEFDALCVQIKDVEEKIRLKQEEMQRARQQPAAG